MSISTKSVLCLFIENRLGLLQQEHARWYLVPDRENTEDQINDTHERKIQEVSLGLCNVLGYDSAHENENNIHGKTLSSPDHCTSLLKDSPK